MFGFSEKNGGVMLRKAIQLHMKSRCIKFNTDNKSSSPEIGSRSLFRSLSTALLLFLVIIASVTSISCSKKKPPVTPPTSSEEKAVTWIDEYSGEMVFPTTPAPAFDLSDDAVVYPDHPLTFISSQEQAVIFGGDNSPYILEGRFSVVNYYDDFSSIYNYAYSLDRESVLFMASEVDTRSSVLMYYDGSEAVEVCPYTEYFCVCDDGSAVAYLLKNTLYVWDASTGNSVLIAEEATPNFVLSPSGSYIAYATGKDFDCYFGPVGGEAQIVDRFCYPIAITDDGSTLYYYDDSRDCDCPPLAISDGESTSYYYDDPTPYDDRDNMKCAALCAFAFGDYRILDMDVEISRKIYSNDSYLIFNRDHSQILFRDHDGSFYFSMNGNEPVPAAGGVVVTENTAGKDDFSLVRRQKVGRLTIFPCFVNKKNLCNLLFRNNDFLQSEYELSYFDENFIVHSFPLGDDWADALLDEARSLIYDRNQERYYSYKSSYVYIVDFTDPDSEQVAFPDEHIYRITRTSNGNFYYLNDVGQLFMVHGDDEPIKIDTYVGQLCPETMVVSGTTYVYYQKDWSEQRALYRIEDVPGATPVTIDIEVEAIDITDAGLLYYKDVPTGDPGVSSWDIFFAKDGLTVDHSFNLTNYDY